VFTVVAQEGSEKSTAPVGSPLDGLVRDGARQMLAAALQAEVAAFIEQFADALDTLARQRLDRALHRGQFPGTVVRAGDAGRLSCTSSI
jgi:hypothetical protein